ncbi:MAG: tripartite tricarboxylate transporter substrate binding protein [Bradyrhizobium sp.]|uniref:Bug family tripartite tricarboxylate transporter substrate binding protein n=1 Tax=Bradyrhizobium sp. TaxID=376 RepID=UPI001203267C|nr:tripartite tricarboxylate transporter substrate binding protein [Bradyrhizobium sp.]THD63489.1 MAG: tripartite tricarboxylate transporter substrate binding protein [Bradyrhizobium sp.]
MMKLRFVGLVLAVTTCAPLVAAAGEWPDHPIHFIVPFPAGGSTDIAARVIGDYLSRTLGQQVVIENKSGANGNIGIEYVAKSAPDGYTILIGTDAVSSNPHVYKMDFDPLKELVPVVEISRQPIALAANPSLGVTTLAQLTELAKKQPGLGFATGSGAGSPQAMVGLWYAKLAGITLEQVPYRGGGQAINDLVAGHIKLGSLGTTPLVPYCKTGGLNLLAQSMTKRSPALPDVPTFQESGLDGLVIDQRIGVFAPAGTPPGIATRLNSEVNAALGDEKVRKIFNDQAQEPAGGTAEQYAKLVRDDSDKYARLVKELNVKVE